MIQQDEREMEGEPLIGLQLGALALTRAFDFQQSSRLSAQLPPRHHYLNASHHIHCGTR